VCFPLFLLKEKVEQKNQVVAPNPEGELCSHSKNANVFTIAKEGVG
jgi:hypothetical protein